MHAEQHAAALLAAAESVSLAYLDENGAPVIDAMELVTAREISEIVLITRRDSRKAGCLRRDPRCCIEYHKDEEGVSLSGVIEVIEAAFLPLLPPAYAARLERRGAESYCLLRFHARTVRISSDGKSYQKVLC